MDELKPRTTPESVLKEIISESYPKQAERTTPERDPRVSPVSGDVLRGKNEGDGSPCRRKVISITPWNVFYRQRGWGSYELITGLSNWRKWAATAEVIQKGDA